MDAFESLISMLLRHDGFWTIPSFKVNLTADDKRRIGRQSSPRWELDIVAFRGSANEVLVVECKSLLDSTGVVYRGEGFERPHRYKLFTEALTREVVLGRLRCQLVESHACPPNPVVTLCLAAGNIATKSDRTSLARHFEANGWRLFDEEWICERLFLA